MGDNPAAIAEWWSGFVGALLVSGLIIGALAFLICLTVIRVNGDRSAAMCPDCRKSRKRSSS